MVPLRPGSVLAAVDRYLALGSLSDFESNSQLAVQADTHLGGARAGTRSGVDADDDDDHPGVHARARVRGVPPKLGRQPAQNDRGCRGHQLLPTGWSRVFLLEQHTASRASFSCSVALLVDFWRSPLITFIPCSFSIAPS